MYIIGKAESVVHAVVTSEVQLLGNTSYKIDTDDNSDRLSQSHSALWLDRTESSARLEVSIRYTSRHLHPYLLVRAEHDCTTVLG